MEKLFLGFIFLAVAQSHGAVDDSFFIPGTGPGEVRAAMNDLDAAGLASFPAPRCLKSILVRGRVERDGTLEYRAAGGFLGVARGRLIERDGGTEVRISADVESEDLHRLMMGTPEQMARRVREQIERRRRRR